MGAVKVEFVGQFFPKSALRFCTSWMVECRVHNTLPIFCYAPRRTRDGGENTVVLARTTYVG